MPSKKQARKASSSLALREATVRRDAAQAQLAVIEAESVERDLRMKRYVQGQAVEITSIPQQVQMIDWMAPEIRRNIGPAGTALGMMLSTDIHDRDRGDDHPFLTTEKDNAEVRGLARFLCTFDITAGSIMGQLEDVVINTGMNHTVKAEQGFEDEVPLDLITAIQRTVNEFRRINGIGRKLEAELFRRSRRDGDLFRRFYPRTGDGSTLMRIVEPDQVSEPGYRPFTGAEFAERYGVYCGDDTNWKYGIHKDNKDSTRIFGYCVRYSDLVWEYVPASQMLHDKENADLNIALGRSDFTPAWEWLLQCSTLLRNLAAGTSDRSSISYTVNYESAAENEVRSMLAASGATAHDIATWGSHYVTILKNGGKKLHLPKGMQVEMPNFGSDGHEGFINVNKHMLRIIATRWRMTEGQVTGDDSNNNRASLEEAGSKFHRYGTVSQSQHGEYLAAGDWMAVDTACRAGHYKQWGIHSVRQLLGMVMIEVTGKPIENRQTLERATTDEIDIRSGVKTVAECQQERGMIVRKKSDGSGVDKSLTAEQNEVLRGYIELATTQGVPVASVRAMASLGLPDVDPLRLDEVFRPLIEAEKAQQQQQAQAAQQQQQAAAPPGEFGGMNLMQQKRNRSSILQVLNQFKTGAMTEAQARTMLATTGLAEPKIDALIADAQDGTLDQPDLLDAVESAVREIYRSDVVAEARGMIAIEFNPNHVPSGPDGGQFTSKGGASGIGGFIAKAVHEYSPDEYKKIVSEKFVSLVEAGESGYKKGTVKIGPDGTLRTLVYRGKEKVWSKPGQFDPAWTQVAADTESPHLERQKESYWEKNPDGIKERKRLDEELDRKYADHDEPDDTSTPHQVATETPWKQKKAEFEAVDTLPLESIKNDKGDTRWTKAAAIKYLNENPDGDWVHVAVAHYDGNNKKTGGFTVQRRKSHEALVREAVASNKGVPAEVLADYPHLKAK